MRLGWAIVWLSSAACAACAQTFEVATVRPVSETVSTSGMRINSCVGGLGSDDPSRYTCRGLSLKRLIEIAYHMTSTDVSGPGWIESARYDVLAKPPAGATEQQLESMLRALLVERFDLKVRRDEKERPIYALLAPHGAARLKPSSDTPEDAEAVRARARKAGEQRRSYGPGVHMIHLDVPKMSMEELAFLLSGQLDRPVHDLTGVSGTFAISIDWAKDMGSANPDSDAPRPPTVYQAMEELGLKLEARKGTSASVVVEDALKKPREN